MSSDSQSLQILHHLRGLHWIHGLDHGLASSSHHPKRSNPTPKSNTSCLTIRLPPKKFIPPPPPPICFPNFRCKPNKYRQCLKLYLKQRVFFSSQSLPFLENSIYCFIYTTWHRTLNWQRPSLSQVESQLIQKIYYVLGNFGWI